MLPAQSPAPSVTGIRRALGESGLEIVQALPAPDREVPAARWEIEVLVHYDDSEGTPIDYRVWLEPTATDEETHVSWDDDDLRQKVRNSRYCLGVSAYFEGKREIDYQRQLELLSIVAPKQIALVDRSACCGRSRQWTLDVLESSQTPHLFEVHTVNEDSGSAVWLHTHGLLRFGIPELEVMDTEQERSRQMKTLLTQVAEWFLRCGTPPMDDAFDACPEIQTLVWLPWQVAIDQLPRTVRHAFERDVFHRAPAAMLFVPQKRIFGWRRYLIPGV
ncbi:MAG: DUF4026 domain-containing protein [Proteobacteria bacterium]|nr:DUF4026 domain-containing protein [Pseudomonadota bacterium]